MRYLSILFLIALISCKKDQIRLIQGTNHFGEMISAEEAIQLENLDLSSLERDTVLYKIKGEIGEVCQAKGCWMTLNSQNSEESIFIRFKDYGFFVPKDSGGKEAVIQGSLFYHSTSVDELRHYAEDKGASQEEIQKITSPKEELRMIADGVIIFNT